MPTWLVILLGYLLGSFPTAYLAGRILKGSDIRQMGDENAGAANVYRELGAGSGLFVFIVDAAKGAAVILIALAAHMSQITIMFAGVAAVAGHNWPVFLGFRGGRGESTTIGILLVLVPLPMLILALPSILILYIRKNVILASAVLFAPLSLVGWWTGEPVPLILYSIALPCLVGSTHFLRTRPKAIQTEKSPNSD
jgi:glycerol-3-phosphate acyltransferase PlsY